MGRFRNVIFALSPLCATSFALGCDKATEPPPDPPAPVDREPLVTLYEATGGPGWINDDGWNTDAPLDEWYGVETDASGRVVSLDLSGTWDEENLRWIRHGLKGPIPLQLGDLSYLRSLVLGGNELQGEIPGELGFLSDLTRLDLSHNTLWGSIPRQLGDLYQLTELNLRANRLGPGLPRELGRLGELTSLDLSRNNLTGPIPEDLGHLSSLKELSLSYNLLTGGIPGDIGRLTELHTVSISHNSGMSGRIPPELGDLSNLTTLLLHDNNLRGEIPPSLGNLASLTTLALYGNRLQGEIPPELGNLASLELLYLDGNRLTGSIPPELGRLAGVEVLSLNNNELSGAIPGALGGLSSAWHVALDHNALNGPIPAGLAHLPRIEQLHLGFNDLTGPIPAELANLATLRELGLMNNPSMAGPLPLELATLPRLEVLLAANTGLCVPADPSLQAWLERVHKRRIAPCDREDPPLAFLIQTVQSWEYPVPLVAGKEALLRVFVTARNPTTETIPPVRARFYHDGVETHVEEIPGKPTPIPTEMVENLLAATANATIPGNVVQPGLEMVIEIDPEGTLNPELLVATRIPESGRLAMEVRTMPVLDLTMVPFVWAEDPDFSIRTLVREMAEDPENHPLLSLTRTLLPILDMEVTSHATVTSASNHSLALLRETTAIRAMEGGTGHYMGMMSPPVSGPSGLAHLPGRSSFSQPYSTLIPHLLGHNFFLGDAPCGDVVRLDRSYPDPLGAIGTWAYDPRGSGRLIPPTRLDIMSYCNPVWISEYHFTNALRFRVSEADSVGLPMAGPSTRALLLWGGVDAEGNPLLEPALVVDAPPAPPGAPGRFRLAGRTADGTELFSLSFEMPEVADGDGGSNFAFVLPAGAAWEHGLASITLSGPGGSATLDTGSSLPLAVLRDPRNGQVHAILRDLPRTVLTAADATDLLSPEPGLELLFSRGIPASGARQR